MRQVKSGLNIADPSSAAKRSFLNDRNSVGGVATTTSGNKENNTTLMNGEASNVYGSSGKANRAQTAGKASKPPLASNVGQTNMGSARDKPVEETLVDN